MSNPSKTQHASAMWILTRILQRHPDVFKEWAEDRDDIAVMIH